MVPRIASCIRAVDWTVLRGLSQDVVRTMSSDHAIEASARDPIPDESWMRLLLSETMYWRLSCRV